MVLSREHQGRGAREAHEAERNEATGSQTPLADCMRSSPPHHVKDVSSDSRLFRPFKTLQANQDLNLKPRTFKPTLRSTGSDMMYHSVLRESQEKGSHSCNFRLAEEGSNDLSDNSACGLETSPRSS